MTRQQWLTAERHLAGRVTAAIIGLLAGMGLGLRLIGGDSSSAAIGVLALVLVAVFVVSGVPTRSRGAMFLILLLAMAARLVVAASLHEALVAMGRGGFFTGDDEGYAVVAWEMAELQRGAEPALALEIEGSVYLGAFQFLETALFLLFGPNVLLVKFVNGFLGVLTALVVFDFARRLFGDRAALVASTLTAFYPSLFFWSVLNLKDTLLVFLIAAFVWATLRLARGAWWAALLLVLVPLVVRNLRAVMVQILLASLAVAILPIVDAWVRRWLAVRWQRAARLPLVYVAVASFVATVLIVLIPAVASERGVFAQFEAQRRLNAIGARTAYVDALPRVVRVGETLFVGGDPRHPRGDPDQIRWLAPDAIVVLSSFIASGRTPPIDRDAVVVSPGEVLVVGPDGTPPSPASEWRWLLFPPNGVVRLSPTPAHEPGVIGRTLTYAPVGLAHALFAPFPWAAEQPQDIAGIPEMLMWYVVLVAATVEVWHRRRALASLLPLLIVVGSTMVLLALGEGNVGSTLRHRSMAIPFVVCLASPRLVAWGGRARSTAVPGGHRLLLEYLSRVGKYQAEALLAIVYWTAVPVAAAMARLAGRKLLPDTFGRRRSHWIDRQASKRDAADMRRQF